MPLRDIRRAAAVLVAALCALVLVACAASPTPTTPGGEPDMDKAAVTAAIEEIPGVASADVGAFNTGTPGSFAARIALTLDESGLARLGEVLHHAVRAVAADPGDYATYEFEVTAPDESEPSDLIVLTLSRYRDRIPFSQGTYLGSTLSLTASELAEVAAG